MKSKKENAAWNITALGARRSEVEATSRLGQSVLDTFVGPCENLAHFPQ